ncbi:MAG: hypothetical protein Q4B05_03390 [Candidatus Saccharibacteria bacterium]|nr:hypothetical protein [Candidatus Saccharibacteria bacterium]
MDNSNQPVMPQQPMSPPPVPGPVGTPYAMPPKKGLSKGALWGIIGGLIGLVLLIVGIILAVVLLGGPSRDDYKAALDRTQEFARNMKTYTSSMAGAADSEDAKKKVDELTKKIDAYLEDLGKEKAMRDADVKKAYDEMSEEYKKLRVSITGVPKVISLKDCRPIYVSIYGRSGGEVMKDFEENTSACSAVLKELKDDADTDIKNYASEYSKYLNDYKEYLNKRVAGQTGLMPPTSPGSAKLYKLLTRVVDDGKKVAEKEKELLKLLGDKAGVKAVVF